MSTQTLTTPFPRGVHVTVTAVRNVDVFRDSWRRYNVLWIIRAPYEYRRTCDQLGFWWDARNRRWCSEHSSDIYSVIGHCDEKAIAAMDEIDPQWREFLGVKNHD